MTDIYENLYFPIITCLSIFTIACFSTFAYMTRCPCISMEYMSDKCRSFQRLKMIVSAKGVSQNAFWASMSLIIKVMYIYIFQYINNSVVEVRKNVYDVNYVVGNRMYTMRVIRPKGPNPIMLAYDQDMNDFTDKVCSYLGPHRDWHGDQITPSMFGVKSMTLESLDSISTYGQDEVLKI